MRNIYAFIISLFFCFNSSSQSFIEIDFETNNSGYTINSGWEVGTPTFGFTEAYSAPNAIVTKLDEAYPLSDDLSFEISYTKKPEDSYWRILFVYKIDSEKSIDTGRIEFSFDNGLTWKNPMIESLDESFVIMEPSPTTSFSEVLSGVNTEWQTFMMEWGETYSQGVENVLIRFTFASDSNETNQAGWMIDDIFIESGKLNGVNSETNTLFSIYPNPATNEVNIKSEEPITSIKIMDVSGKLILESTFHTVDVSSLLKGIYYVKAQFFNGNSSYEKLIITK
jgi:hypothetical protein